MASVDDRIVSIEFDNSGFERKLGETIASLDKLTEALQLKGGQDGLEAVSESVNQFDTSNMASAIENISSKFTALGAIGFSVIQQLTQNIAGFVASTVKEDVLGPIITGGKQRALNIEQAKFMFRGLGTDVEAGMASALAAVKGTAYGLDEAAKAASQLSASGIAVGDDMTNILSAIAGTAAMTGSSFSEMADIFTASAGSGKVNTQDLLQFSTRGLNAAAALAKEMGLTEAQVREMASEGKLDFKTFSDAMTGAFGANAKKANETYAGSLANVRAAMSRLGASFFGTKLEQQRDIFNALTPVIDKVNTALQPLIKAFLELTGIGTFRIVDFLNNLDLSGFTAAIPNFADAFKNAFAGIAQVLAPIKDAFREIFPKSSISIILKISEAVKSFSEKLKIGAETAGEIKSVFKGLFSVIEIGWTILKEFYKTIAMLVTAIFPATGGLLKAGAAGGDFLTKMNELLVAGGGIHNFFEKLRDVIKGPIEFIGQLRDKLGDLADVVVTFLSGLNLFGKGSDIAESGLGRVDSRVDQMRDTANKVSIAWDNLKDRLRGVFEVFDNIWDYIKNWFAELGSKLAAAFKPGDFNAAVDIINVGLLGGIAIMLKKLLTGGFKLDFGEGIFAKMGDALDGMKEKMKAISTEIKADTLLKIAGAVALLTASIVVLSLIDSANLTKALAAMAVGLGELIGSMALMEKIGGEKSAAKLTLLGIVMIELSVSMLILAVAMRIMGTLDWDEVTRGLIGIGIGMGMLLSAVSSIGKDLGSIIRAGLGMILISTGLLILSTAVRSFATMSWGDLAKGLIGAGIGLAGIAIAMKNMPAASALSGIGVIEVAVGLTILAGAVKLFSLMSWADMAKGMVGIAGGLAAITLALNFMPATSVLSGLGFIAVAVGLNILFPAVKLFSTLSWGEMAKGLVGIAGGLIIIGLAMNLMPLSMIILGPALIVVATALTILAEVLRLIGTLSLGDLVKGILGFAAMLFILAAAMHIMQSAVLGAVALVIVAGAMTILTGVLTTMAALSWEDLIRGLVGIAAVLAILGIAALVMEPIVPALLALGLALSVVGVAFALFGVGAMLLAKSFEVMAESGVAGAHAIVEALKILITALPEIAKAIGQTIIGTTEELLAAVPLLIRLITAILSQLLDTVIQLAPKLAEALIAVIDGVLKILREKFPEYVQTGLEMLLALLRGIRDNIGEIVTLVAEIIVNFIDALNEKVPEIVESLYNLLITIATELAYRAGELQTAFIPIGIAFLDGLLAGLTSGAGQIFDFFWELPGRIITIFKELLGIGSPSTVFLGFGVDLITGLLNGLWSVLGTVTNFFMELPGKILGWLGDMLSFLFTKGIDILTGLWNGIWQKAGEIHNWFAGLGGTIIGWIGDALSWLKNKGIDILQGLWNGITEKATAVFDWFKSIGSKIMDAIPKPWEILNALGKDIINGLWNGIKEIWNKLTGWISDAASHLPGFIKGPLHIGSPSKVFMEIGVNVMEGFYVGMNNEWGSVAKWLGGINPADHIEFDLTSTITKIADQLSGMDEFNPVITPVLDLTRVQADSANLEKYMRLAPITPDISLDRARLVEAAAATTSATTPSAYTGPTEVNFEQNIYAPKQLSTNDIYRNTKSQIALAKEELGIK